MHVGPDFLPGFIDKSDLIQRHPFDRLPGSDAFLPADFPIPRPQGPVSRPSSLNIARPASLSAVIFNIGKRRNPLDRLSIHHGHKSAVEIVAVFQERAIHRDPFDAEAIDPANGYQ